MVSGIKIVYDDDYDDDPNGYYSAKSDFMDEKMSEWIEEGNNEEDFNEDDFLDDFHNTLEDPPSMQSLGMTWREFL